MVKLNLASYRYYNLYRTSISKRPYSTVNNSFKIQDVNDFNEKVKNSKKPVVVDFFAVWCNPCKLLAPRIENIIDEQKGKILLAKVDIDELSDLALDYEVSVVPTLIVFNVGKPQGRMVGVQDMDLLRSFVTKYIDNK